MDETTTKEQDLSKLSNEELARLDEVVAEVQETAGPPPGSMQLWKDGPYFQPGDVIPNADKDHKLCGGRGIVRRAVKNKARQMVMANEVCGCAILAFLKLHGKEPVAVRMPEEVRRPAAAPKPAKGPDERAGAIVRERAKAQARIDEIEAKVADRARPIVERLDTLVLRGAQAEQRDVACRDAIDHGKFDIAEAGQRIRGLQQLVQDREAAIVTIEAEREQIAQEVAGLAAQREAAADELVALRKADRPEMKPLLDKVDQCNRRLQRLRIIHGVSETNQPVGETNGTAGETIESPSNTSTTDQETT